MFHAGMYNMSTYDVDFNLFIAAAHLNLLPVIRDMIDPIFKQNGPQFRSEAFGNPYSAAAAQDNDEVLRLMLERVLSFPSSKTVDFEFQRVKALSVAARCGHLKTVDMLLEETWPPLAI